MDIWKLESIMHPAIAVAGAEMGTWNLERSFKYAEGCLFKSFCPTTEVTVTVVVIVKEQLWAQRNNIFYIALLDFIQGTQTLKNHNIAFTVMSASPSQPMTLYLLRILKEDKQTGQLKKFMETLHTELQPYELGKKNQNTEKFDSHDLGTVWLHQLYA